MAEAKPKPYSKRRQGTKVAKGDAQSQEKVSVPTKQAKEPVPPKKESMETPKGKQYQVVRKGLAHEIEFTTGGQIPKELSGQYTKEAIAWQAIRAYEAKRKG